MSQIGIMDQMALADRAQAAMEAGYLWLFMVALLQAGMLSVLVAYVWRVLTPTLKSVETALKQHLIEVTRLTENVRHNTDDIDELQRDVKRLFRHSDRGDNARP